VTAKPTVTDLGVDPAAQVWHRSGHGDGAIEVAFVRVGGAHSTGSANTPASASADTVAAALASADGQEWVLMRVAGDPEQRVLVFDRHEWECFLDGARNGEFDDAAASS
jgi:Domain of unknown function (DUF397)